MRALLLLTLCVPLLSLPAAESSTLVRRVIGRASAAASAQLPPGTTFTTGPRSKSELSLPAGTVRVGEQAELETQPRGLVLRRGVTLVASEPGNLRKTIEVRAPGYRLKVKGTVQVAYDPGHTMKVVVLEGRVTVALDSLAGEFETLQPGQMLVINPSDRRLPEPVEIDVQRLVSTSALVNGEFGALATAGSIKAAGSVQVAALQAGQLETTPLLLRGLDTTLELQRRADAVAARLAPPSGSLAADQRFFNLPDDLSDPNVTVHERTFLFKQPVGLPLGTVDSVATTTFARDTDNPGRTRTLNIRLEPSAELDDPFAPVPKRIPVRAPQLSGTIDVSADFFGATPKVLQFNTGPTSSDDHSFAQLETLDGTIINTPKDVGLSFLLSDGMKATNTRMNPGKDTKTQAPLTITTTQGTLLVEKGSVFTASRIALVGAGNASGLQVDKSTLKARGNLTLGNDVSSTGIDIRNSSVLASVAANLSLITSRNRIDLTSGANLSAHKRLLVDAYLKEMVDEQKQRVVTPGIVNVQDATLGGQSIRMRAFGNDGKDSLYIDNTTLNATQSIKLFAEGASILHFGKKNVYLNTPLAVLAGSVVQVDQGGRVIVDGKVSVFTDDDRYNKSGYGDIEAHGGVPPKMPFSARKSFR